MEFHFWKMHVVMNMEQILEHILVKRKVQLEVIITNCLIWKDYTTNITIYKDQLNIQFL